MNKIKKIAKIALLSALAVILLFISFVIYSVQKSQKKMEQRAAAYYEQHKEELEADPNALDFSVQDSPEPLQEDTFSSSFGDTIRIYDNDFLDQIPGYNKVSYADLYQVLESNGDIEDKYRPLVKHFIERLEAVYPDIELWPFYQNLRTLRVVSCTESEMTVKTLSFDSKGCYVHAENTIYVLDNYVFTPGTWDYQTIMHELSHALRTVSYDDGDTRAEIQFMGAGHSITIAEEALNTLFSVSLFEYEELDIAYQLQSNIFSVLVECTDEYRLDDYANHSITYFMKKLDEETGHNNYASSMLLLIEAQYNDFHNPDIHRDQSVYYPIYDFLTGLYLDHYASVEMTAEEREALVNELVERVMFDVPAEYEIDVEEFSRFAETYSPFSENEDTCA